MEDTEIKKPSFLKLLAEAPRSLLELGSFWPYRLISNFPTDGDGHPVLILPGFMATDMSTIPLRSFIYKLGYKVYGWGEGRNYGDEEYVELLLQKIDKMYEKHQEKISLIGWSLGGIYARQLGKARPDKIRQIITLGSPFKGITISNNAKWMYEILVRGKSIEDIDPKLIADIPNPAPVPTTAVYSKNDGIVPWELCMEQEENAIHQNIEVRSSHLGFSVNPAVLHIIADRLKLNESNWSHFVPENIAYDYYLFPSLETTY